MPEFDSRLFAQVLAALVAVQLVRLLESFCRILIFMNDKAPGGMPLSAWWTAIDVRAGFWIVLAPALAAIILARQWQLWKKVLAHLLLLAVALAVDGLYLHRIAHYQAEQMQHPRQSEVFDDEAAPDPDQVTPLAGTPRRAALLRAYADVDFRKPSGMWYWVGELLLMLTYYLTMTILGYAVLYFRISQDRTLQAERLRQTLIEQRHESLCSRLTHHFLFNTFNTISALTLTDSRAARTCISQLSELLRASIDALPKGEIRLHKELEILGIYLALQKTRFGDKLEYSFDIEPGLSGALVPAFLLQPIVENCFEHGFREQVENSRIRISAQRDGDYCRLEVADNGAVVALQNKIDENYGLGITRERLRLQYGGAADIWYEPNQPNGLRVSIAVPFRLDDEVNA